MADAVRDRRPASEILGLDVEDLDLEQRRAPIRSKGGDTEFVYWDTGTAHLLPRLLRLPDGTPRTSGPLFLASRRPVPARRPAPRDICPHTGRGRLGYDRARILFKKYTATAASEDHELRPPARLRVRSVSSAGELRTGSAVTRAPDGCHCHPGARSRPPTAAVSRPSTPGSAPQR